MSIKGNWRGLTAVLAAGVLVATACGPTAPTGGAPTATAAAGQPQQGGRLIIGFFSDVQRLNPAMSNDNVSSHANDQIYASLLTVNHKTAELLPNLGKWTVSADGLTFSWEIDAKANWSDGKPITGNDYLTRLKVQGRSKVTPNKSVFNDVEGYQDYTTAKATSISGIVVDPTNPKKFTVKFAKVFCNLTSAFGSAPLPEHVFGKYIVDADATKNADDAPENTAPPLSSGPFIFKEWRKGDQVIFVRNPNYFKGAPLVDEYVMKVVTDTTVLAAQLKTGELTHASAPAAADIASLQAAENLQVHRFPNNGYTYIGWRANNPNVAFLQDKRIRQALSYGINTEEIVKAVYFGEGTKQVQHHPPASWASAPANVLNEYKYDPAKAKSLIESAGYTLGADGVYAKDGKPLAMSIVTNQGNKARETFLQVAVEQYKQIGVKINPKIEAFTTLVPKLTGGAPEIEALIIGWQLGGDPDPFTIWHSSNVASPTKAGNNFVGYSNPRIDQLLDQGRNGPDCSQAARDKVYEELNKILNEDVPYMFGVSNNNFLVADKRIQGIDVGSFSPNSDWNIEKWWFKQ